MSPDRQFAFPILTAEVVDGDTYRANVDLGFRLTGQIEIRLNGWDCPEKRSSATRKVTAYEKVKALDAERLATEWFEHYLDTAAVWVYTQKDPEKYGRWLGDVVAHLAAVPTAGLALQPLPVDLGHALGEADLATPWPTRWWTQHPQAA